MRSSTVSSSFPVRIFSHPTGRMRACWRDRMKLIWIYGLPGVGKLSVAQELSKITGYKLFHNHLAVDLAWSLFDFGSPPFVELREELWLRVFDYACRYEIEGLIFTFVFDDTVRPGFVGRVREVMAGRGSIHFVELRCDLDELKRRVAEPSRRGFRKIASAERLLQLLSEGVFLSPQIDGPVLCIDNTDLGPAEVAMRIAGHLTAER
jgi:hypothetical protein